jgi:2-oxoglutarate ferredoxin oxidoreductase subunit alpha
MAEKIIMKGNEALAEAAIGAGCKHFFGYPITPQTEVAAYMAKRLPQIGGTFLQAESEVAAINMVLGASAAGVRAMTSSSSPGVSLKAEGISYLAGCDLPCLIVNIQRGGPGLGGIQPAQSDYFLATKSTGHGDLHILVFAPATVQEMADLVADAFSLADKYRMPAMVLADGMLGQMMEPVILPEESGGGAPEKPWAVDGHKNSRPHNVVNSLYLEPEQLEAIVVGRFARYEEVKRKEQRAEEYLAGDAEIILVAYGAASRIVKSAIGKARAEGIRAGLIRPVTLCPYPDAVVEKYIGQARVFLCVEMSMGQMLEDLRLAVDGRKPVSFYGRTGGVLPTPDEVYAKIKEIAGGLK